MYVVIRGGVTVWLAVARSGRLIRGRGPLDLDPRLGSAGPRRARALLCTARASRPRERRARRAVRWFCLRGFTPIDSPSPRSPCRSGKSEERLGVLPVRRR